MFGGHLVVDVAQGGDDEVELALGVVDPASTSRDPASRSVGASEFHGVEREEPVGRVTDGVAVSDVRGVDELGHLVSHQLLGTPAEELETRG